MFPFAPMYHPMLFYYTSAPAPLYPPQRNKKHRHWLTKTPKPRNELHSPPRKIKKHRYGRSRLPPPREEVPATHPSDKVTVAMAENTPRSPPVPTTAATQPPDIMTTPPRATMSPTTSIKSKRPRLSEIRDETKRIRRHVTRRPAAGRLSCIGAGNPQDGDAPPSRRPVIMHRQQPTADVRYAQAWDTMDQHQSTAHTYRRPTTPPARATPTHLALLHSAQGEWLS